MSTSIRPLRARAAIPSALANALQWRLLVLWVLASLACALAATLPLRSWLTDLLNHSISAQAIAAGQAPMRLLDAVMSPSAPWAALSASQQTATWLMLALSPLLTGAAVAASRSRTSLGFGDLLRGGIGEYGPMLRLLLWSVLPLGAAILITSAAVGFNAKTHEHAILASEISQGSKLILSIGGVLVLLAHASVEAGRGWLAADVRLRSAVKAWWRGLKLLLKRPIAVLCAYLIPTLLSFAAALGLLWLRQHTHGASLAGFWGGLLLASGIAAALAWGRVARLFALSALAADRNIRR
ncbi:MAG: hypothetical protein KUL77_11245 [Thermomonas sp.]|uniref:hypothetical protein n=1 Tax=Thermomonas sp. TaxID=1971895 RepID=UPI001EB7BD6A|nr:hypothetical protein [Thermomonas sp.]MBV2210124.1 hypothetical protein [Thermomonas sp.]